MNTILKQLLIKLTLADLPSHLKGTDSALPSSDKRWVSQQRNRVEGPGGKVGSHWTNDDEYHGFPSPRHPQRGLENRGGGVRRWEAGSVCLGDLAPSLTSVPMKVGLM